MMFDEPLAPLQSPCRKCELRHTACWSTCAAYQDYRVTVDQINAARAGEVTATGIAVDRSEKIRKRHAVHGVYGGRKRR